MGSSSSSSSSSSPQIDNMYLQPSLKPFFGVTRSGHQQQEQEQEQQTQKQLKNLRKFTLSCFKISKDDIHYLRNGILQSSLGELVPSQSTIATCTTGTGGSSLEELSFSNVTFVDNGAVQELGEAVASMSSHTTTNGRDDDWSKKYLRELSLVGCNLNDEQLETIVRTLMTKVPSIACTSVSSLTNNKKWTTRSTLSKLNLSFTRCGGKCLHALGSWLLSGDDNNNNSSVPPGIISCCSLESIQISNNIKEIPNQNYGRNDDGNNVAAAAEEEEEEEEEELNSNNNFSAKNSFKMGYLFSHDPQTTSRAAATAAGYRAKNSTLKRLRLDGNPSLGNAEDNDNNLSYLGHFVSNHLLALEELDLDSCGITDTGLAKFASSSSAAGATAAILLTTNHKQQQQQQKKNRALRRLRLSGNNSLTSISCAY